MPKLKTAVILVVLCGVAAAGLWYWRSRPVEVAVVAPKLGSAAEVVYASGVVEPKRWAKVASLLRGRIVELCSCEGDAVAEGDLLGRLDASDAQATLAELEARADLAKADLDRATDLLERRVVSRQTYERAENEHSRMVALVAAQKARLADYELRAPMDGIVLRRDGEVGEVAEPGEVLFWVGNPDPLQVVADVNEEDIPLVEVGQDAKIRADAFPDSVVDAKVERITPKGDPVLKTYRVYLSLPRDAPLRIGMTTDVNIIVREVENTLLVPLAAFDGDAVFVLEGDKVVRKTVETGIRGVEFVEVREGLTEQARVVSPWRDDLTNGQAARAVRAAAAP